MRAEGRANEHATSLLRLEYERLTHLHSHIGHEQRNVTEKSINLIHSSATSFPAFPGNEFDSTGSFENEVNQSKSTFIH